jgi:transcription-repair coupling factor (superfamily II helicase)
MSVSAAINKSAPSIILTGVPEGYDALVIAGMAAEMPAGGGEPVPVLHIARDDRRLEALEQGLKFFAPDTTVIAFPAWDCVPYDRVSPNSEIVARRIAGLTRLAAGKRKGPLVVLTTVNGLLQRVPPRAFVRDWIKPLAPGQRVEPSDLAKLLERAGFQRVSTVMEHGDFAVRGGIVDLFPPGRQTPVRLDFFGDNLETIKPFDPETQRTHQPINKLTLLPVSEVAFGNKVVSDFRRRYIEMFGAVTSDDPLYESISAGARYHGMEHWLPLFHTSLETLIDYVPDAVLSLDHSVDDAIERRMEQVKEHFLARADAMEQQSFGAPPYKPIPPQQLYLQAADWRFIEQHHLMRRLSQFDLAGSAEKPVLPMGGKVGRNFASERQDEGKSVFQGVAQHIKNLHGKHRRARTAGAPNGGKWCRGYCQGGNLGRSVKAEKDHGCLCCARHGARRGNI